MKDFKYLTSSAVEVRIMIQELDKDREVRFDCIYNLQEDDLTDLLQTIKDYHDSLEDLHYNPCNKEELGNRLSKAVSSV